VARGEVALDGGWRVYSSGPGLALALIVGRFLGLRRESACVVFDPVLPPALAGLVARLPLLGVAIELELQPGPLGHGPSTLLLDGEPLPFTREANPYRLGGARVENAELQRRLATGSRRLVVHTG
jgi:cellobiose phosphorylase